MKKRILILNDRLHSGGAERIVQTVAALAAEDGWELTLWAPEGDREQLRRHYPAGLRWRRFPFWDRPCRRFSPAWFLRRFCRVLFEGLLLRLRRWDRVVAMKEGPCMRLGAKLRAGKKLAWVHADYRSLHWSHWHFRSDEEELNCMAAYDRVVCVSESVRESIRETLGDPGNLRVLYNPVDAPSILRLAGEEIPEPPPEGEGPLLIAVGRLDGIKRFDLLLELCRDLAPRHPLRLWIVGDGPEREKLERLAAELPFVRLLGAKENPYPYIARSDWLISCSGSESYGLTVQEALILGVPVLACACPAIRETLDPRFGLLTELDRASLEEGLRTVLSRPELGESFREAIRAGYDAQALWRPRLEAIRSLIEGE